MSVITSAQTLLNTGLLVYAAIALCLLGMLALLCVGVAIVERRGEARAKGRAKAPARAMSYGATRRRVLGAR